MQFLLAVQSSGGGLGSIGLIAPLIFMFAVFYFLLIMPQQRRQKKWQAMLEQLKTGDKVTTSGGLRGTVMAIKDDAIHLNVPPNNTRLEVTKASVVAVTTADEEVKSK
jgi:preprotein translocase subunit YajC